VHHHRVPRPLGRLDIEQVPPLHAAKGIWDSLLAARGFSVVSWRRRLARGDEVSLLTLLGSRWSTATAASLRGYVAGRSRRSAEPLARVRSGAAPSDPPAGLDRDRERELLGHLSAPSGRRFQELETRCLRTG
jgi:hypothetical protein